MRLTPTEMATASSRLAAMKRVVWLWRFKQRVGGLAAADAAWSRSSDDRVGESGSLLGGVDLLVDAGERVPAPVGVVVFDRFA